MADCAIPHCSQPAEARRLCNPHYQRWKRGAPYPAPLTRTPRGRYTSCTVDDCGHRHFGKGLCRKHYERQRVGAPLEGPRATRLGEAHPRAALTVPQVREIRALDAAGWSRARIGRHLGVSASAVQGVVSGRTWRHV
jgi:hypothetical protein